MPLNFYDAASGEKIGSTRLAREVILSAVKDIDPGLFRQVKAVKKWRKQYQAVYRDLAQCEFYQENNLLDIASKGLATLSNSIRDENAMPLPQIISSGWSGRAQVETFVISGSGSPKVLQIPGFATLTDAAQTWSNERIAEPGLVSSFKFLDAHKKLAISADLLVALAGAAEYGPTKHWLALGGTVAVAARPGSARWLDLITHARKSAGTLLVPVLRRRVPDDLVNPNDVQIADIAGVDLVDDAEQLASWVSELASSRSERIVLGQYAYAPGAKHILVQAVQDALAEQLCKKLAPTRIALAWLATPTDSIAVPASVLESSLIEFAERPRATKLRDATLLMRKTEATFFKTRFGEKLALIDPTSSMQGSSYALAKRTQRWRAYLANSQGVRVSYAVSPPARTRSVLSHRILRATYAGAPKFGLKPFEVVDASLAATAVLLRDLHGPMHSRGSTSIHTDNAIHGGLWRLIYRTKQVWSRATLLGFWALILPKH
jgi:hypothetical protein